MYSTKSVELGCCGKYEIYVRPDLALSITFIVTGHQSFCVTVMGQLVYCTVGRA